MRALLLASAWLAGLFLGSLTAAPWASLALFSVAALVLALLLHRGAAPWALALLPLVLLLGMVRTQPLPWQEPLPHVAEYNDAGPVWLRAQVVEDPYDTGVRLRVTLAAQRVEDPQGQRQVRGRVLAFLPSSAQVEEAPPLRPGDRVVLHGTLTPPPIFEELDYRAYLASQGVGSVMFQPEVEVLPNGVWSLQRALSPWRHRLARSLEDALPEPEGALARTLVVGLRGALPPPVTEAFRTTGTSHLLAISGLHVALVMGMLLSIGEGALGRRRHLYLLPPLAGVWLYALLAGMSPSVSRAAVMATLFLVALALGRQSSLLTALALTAAVMVGLEPALLGDVSFQLSFAAVGGIALLFPWLRDTGRALVERLGRPEGALSPLVLATDAVALSLAATLATLPLLALHFERLSLLSVPLTVALLPALPPALLLSFLTALVGLVSPALAQVVGWADWVFLRYLLVIARTFGELPGVYIRVEGLSPLLVWVYYGALAAVGWLASGRRLLWRQTPRSQGLAYDLPGAARAPLLYLGLFLLLASGFLWASALQASDGRLHVTVLDVGQGDAILVQSPAGHQALIDGGRDPRLLLTHLSDRLPLWGQRLDLIVLTHPDGDHLLGLLGALQEYPVGAALEPEVPSDAPGYARWKGLLRAKDIPVLTARAGMVVRLGPEVEIAVFHPPEPLLKGTRNDDNNNGVVLRLRYGRATFLLPGDIEEEAEDFLVRYNPELGSTVLNVAHHGSATSTTTPFLRAVAPLVAVVSVGADNPYGHPDPDVMARLRQQVEHLFLTSQQGSVEMVTDGVTLWVHPQR